jgi:hypothetical protein
LRLAWMPNISHVLLKYSIVLENEAVVALSVRHQNVSASLSSEITVLHESIQN